MEELIDIIIKFRDDRNWSQFHNPKDLAISLTLEANELLENFQWRNSEEAIENNMDNIKDELADVFYYVLLLSHELGIDIQEALKSKMGKNIVKYPIEKSFGRNKKYTDL